MGNNWSGTNSERDQTKEMELAWTHTAKKWQQRCQTSSTLDTIRTQKKLQLIVQRFNVKDNHQPHVWHNIQVHNDDVDDDDDDEDDDDDDDDFDDVFRRK